MILSHKIKLSHVIEGLEETIISTFISHNSLLQWLLYKQNFDNTQCHSSVVTNWNTIKNLILYNSLAVSWFKKEKTMIIYCTLTLCTVKIKGHSDSIN